MELFDRFMEMIEQSWTWARLTEAERARIKDRLWETVYYKRIKTRSDKNLWEILHQLYASFLDGCGYQAIGWREGEAV